jgi:predicted acyl esterase
MAIALVAGVPVVARGSAPDLGRTFVPAPVSRAVYGIGAPKTHIVRAADGADLFVETWLPSARNGHRPPARVPVVLLYSAGSVPGVPRILVSQLVPYGYAVAQAHVRGTGGSGGCFDYLGRVEQDDGAHIVEYLGRDAAFSNGNVGMAGISYDGGTQVAVATSPDRARVQYLKAIIPAAPAASLYAAEFADGVARWPFPEAALAVYEGQVSLAGTAQAAPARLPERPGCIPQQVMGTIAGDGGLTPYFRDREHRFDADKITAATLYVHGTSDTRVVSSVGLGFFDRLPTTTPRAAVVGVWNHEYPDDHAPSRNAASPSDTWERADWPSMVVAWFDRWLKGLDTGVEHWPVVQVQDTEGQWRAEDNWPHPSGPPGQLAVGPAGRLGVARPSGATTFTDGFIELDPGGHLPGTALVFETPPLRGVLELAGAVVLDAWVVLDRPDAQLVARLEALDRDGNRTIPEATTNGARSLRHLAPLEHELFVQPHGAAPAVGTPIPVQVRFNPHDLVVPEGGRLRLTLAGNVHDAWDGFEYLTMLAEATVESRLGVDVPHVRHTVVHGPYEPSLSFTQVSVLHDCAHPTVLRFTMPDAERDLLNVREDDEHVDELPDNPAGGDALRDGGGVASQPICGRLATPQGAT